MQIDVGMSRSERALGAGQRADLGIDASLHSPRLGILNGYADTTVLLSWKELSTSATLECEVGTSPPDRREAVPPAILSLGHNGQRLGPGSARDIHELDHLAIRDFVVRLEEDDLAPIGAQPLAQLRAERFRRHRFTVHG